MPTSPGLSRKYPHCYPAPRKFALVIGCVDCRLLDDLVRFLDHDNLNNRYYQVSFAGASIGLSDSAPSYYPRCDKRGKPVGDRLDFSKWKKALIDHLKLVLKLTKGDLTDVYIVEHADCGAYKEFLKKDYYENPTNPDSAAEQADHEHYAQALADDLAKWYESNDAKELGKELKHITGKKKLAAPLVRGFLMDLRGGVHRLFGPGDENEDESYQ
jgi:hypothetical protein